MNDFRAGLRCANNQEKSALQIYSEKLLDKYLEFRNNTEIRNYFNHLVAAVMISQYEQYPQSGINIPYRYKSIRSIRNKVNKRLEEATENGIINLEKVRPILDIFAMEIISRRRPTITTSNNPEIQKLLDEQKENQEFLLKFQKFKGRILRDDLKPPRESNYFDDYSEICTRKEFLTVCQEVLERLRGIVDLSEEEKSKDADKEQSSDQDEGLIAHYDTLVAEIQRRLSLTDDKEPIDQADLNDEKINFFSLLTEFETKLHNKTELAILTEQVISLFENNPLLESLGAHLSPEPVEKKRTTRGFESNFIYIDTPFGRIECQLQTEEQYRFGNYGFAAHTKMTGKKLEPVTIPDDLKSQINEKIQIAKNAFLEQVKDMSPDTYLARMDDNERGRVMTMKFGLYQNYKKVVTQIAANDPSERFVYNYFARLYSIRELLFGRDESSLGFIRQDIKAYTNNEFKELLSNAPNFRSLFFQKDEKGDSSYGDASNPPR